MYAIQAYVQYQGFIQDFRVGGIKCVHKHVTRALMTFWKFLSRKIIEFQLNLHTTVSINTVNFVYSWYDIHCIHNYYILRG